VDRAPDRAPDRTRRPGLPARRPPPPPPETRPPMERPVPDIWIDEGPVRDLAEEAVARATDTDTGRPAVRSIPSRLPDAVVDELARAVGANHAPRRAERLDAARGAFERERYQDARRILARLATEAPGAAAVRELHGLTLYRLDRWKQAAAELEAYRALTG